MTQPITLSRPDLDEYDRLAVMEVLAGPVLSRGEALEAFEAAFVEITGQSHAVGVSSGTAALHLALGLAGVTTDSEVITTGYSVPASINPIFQCGATPVLVDIHSQTRALDPVNVENAITARTRAILAVHPQASMADMPALREIADRHGVGLIEDACEALGSAENVPAGAGGDMAAFGFYPNKQITTGEGGMLVTSDARMAARARRLRNHGRHMDGRWLDQDEIGFNYRLSEIAAALGHSQMQRLNTLLTRRQRLAARYDQALGGNDQIELPPRSSVCGWFCYVVLVPEVRRDQLSEQLARAEIQSGRYFAPLHQQPAIVARLGPQSLPNTERIARRSLALPLHGAMSISDVDRVCAILTRTLSQDPHLLP